MVHLALSKIILNSIEINNAKKKQIIDALKTCFLEPPIFDQICNENSMIKLSEKLKIQLHKFEENGSTFKLWIQYFHMICLMKEYIVVERMGNWNLHIQCT